MLATARKRLSLDRFLKGEGPEAGPITLRQRRVYILPTRSGLIFALILFAMLLGAVNYNNSLAHALTFLLASLAVVSILHTYRNLHGLSFRAGQCRPIFAGETAQFPVLIENHGGRQRLGIKLAWPKEAPITVDLDADGMCWLDLERKTTRRGRLAMGRFTVYTRFPLGLFHAWSHVHFDVDCLVYPRPAPERGLPRDLFQSTGAEGDRGRGGDDFAGLRPYHPGDSLRHVHWKAVAREQGLLTKQFGGEQAAELWLNWEALAGLDAETRLSRLCRWVLEAETAGLTYGLALPQRSLPPGRGDAHRWQCLEALALFGE